MKFFKKQFNKKSKLSMCDNVTRQTRTSNHTKMENVSRIIDLVQEPGIAKEIFEMQYEPTIYTLYGYVQIENNFCGYSLVGHDYNDVRCKLNMELYKLWKGELTGQFGKVERDDVRIFTPNFDIWHFFSNLDDSICKNKVYSIKENKIMIFTCFVGSHKNQR